MTEPSVDRTNDAQVKAQAEVKRAENAVAIAKAEDERAQEVEARAQSAKRITVAQLDETANGLASIEAQERGTDPNDNDAIRWLVNERAIAETTRRALEGRRQREQEQLEKAQADANTASAAVERAKAALEKARAHLSDAQDDAWEARLIAAKEPLPQHLEVRRAWRQRQEEIERQRERDLCWDEARRRYLANIGERCPSIEEKMRMEDELFNLVWAERHGEKPPKTEPSPVVRREPPRALQSGEQGWGRHLHAFDSTPVQSIEKVS